MSATNLGQIPIGPLWRDTSRERPLHGKPASGNLKGDVIVIGAGYTGLSCALHLAADHGRQVIVLEADDVGSGASGVNGGQVIPGLKRDPDDLERLMPEGGAAISKLFGEGADLVFSLVDRHSIDCSPRRGGWILAAHSAMALSTVQRRGKQWQERGADVTPLSAIETEREIGTPIYPGGFIDRRAGTIQPLAYARGLARALVQAGGLLFERSRATSINRRGGAWHVAGEGFEVVAPHAVVATDAYSGPLLPELQRSLLTVNSLQIATEPLAGAAAEKILPSGACMSETRKVAIYMRRDPDGRLLIGGRGPVGDSGQDALFRDIYDRLRATFSTHAPFRITHKWHGKVGLTLDELPHLHEPEEGLLIGVGYNGRGVAAATTMGKIIAGRICGDEIGAVLPTTGLSRIPWRSLRQPLLSAAVQYYRMRDKIGLGS